MEEYARQLHSALLNTPETHTLQSSLPPLQRHPATCTMTDITYESLGFKDIAVTLDGGVLLVLINRAKK